MVRTRVVEDAVTGKELRLQRQRIGLSRLTDGKCSRAVVNMLSRTAQALGERDTSVVLRHFGAALQRF